MIRIPRFMFPTPVTFTPKSGEGAYGPIYGDPFTVQGRVEPEVRVIRGADGQDIVTSGRVFTGPGITIYPQSTVEIDGETFTVIRAALQHGPSGEHTHIEVWFQ